MRKEYLHIQKVKHVAADTYEMNLVNDYISRTAKPGQFLHIAIPGLTLRRPVSIADCNKANKTITILFKINGQGTALLAAFAAGEMIDAIGPCGNEFPLVKEKEILLIGGGIGIPPLHYLGKKLLSNNCKIHSILGFQTRNHVFYESEFQRLGETTTFTNDGSYGKKGLVTDELDEKKFDYYYACGPIPMLRAIMEKLQGKEGFISLEERMGCGVGACYACVVKTVHEPGYAKICHNGPVFPAGEVIL